MGNKHQIHQDRDDHIGHNESKNSKYYKVFLDRRGGDRYLIGITDDYIVKFVCQPYNVCAYDTSAPEYQTFIN